MKKKLSLILIALFVSLIAIAQNRTIKGILIDAESGEPIVGAAITLPGGQNGVVSNLDGEFTVNVKNEAQTLFISCLGYKNESVQLGRSNSVGTIRMQSEDYKLQDVIVSGQVAVSRKTPVVSSSVKAIEIEEKLGNQ